MHRLLLLLLLGAYTAQDQSTKRIDRDDQPLNHGMIATIEKQKNEEDAKLKNQPRTRAVDQARMEPDPEIYWEDARKEKMRNRKAD